jgi:hypothetical protein
MDVFFIRKNKAYCAIIIFIISMFVIHTIKPTIIYDESGCFRYFGIGYKNKTILPIWLVSIIVAILSYLFILVFSTV